MDGRRSSFFIFPAIMASLMELVSWRYFGVAEYSSIRMWLKILAGFIGILYDKYNEG
jgi:hypothetical protein